MKIQLNGEEYTTKGAQNVIELLSELNIMPERVAVEVNLKILKKDEYPSYKLKEDDKLEIVSFVGGG